MSTAFDYQSARKAGYSDDEITEFLSKKHSGFDVGSARKSGYSPEEINEFLSKQGPSQQEEPENLGRASGQLALGALEATPYGLATSAWETLGRGEALSELEDLEERLPDLKKKFPQFEWPEKIDKEKYLEATKTATGLIPSIGNLAGAAEETTGLPLTAKTDLDKTLRFIGQASKFGSGSPQEKVMGGLKASAVKSGLDAAGVPEPASDLLALYYGLRQKTPKINVKELEKEGATTGLPEEVHQKKSVNPTEIIAPEKQALSRKSLEQDFRKFSDELFSKNRTYEAIKEDPSFKDKISGLFEEVEKLAEGMKEQIPLSQLEKSMMKRFKERPTAGITDSEAEKTFKKAFSGYFKEINKKGIRNPEAHVKDFLKQYRKNSEELAKYFEPGKSSSYNTGKRDALLEYNNAIQDVFETALPKDEFTKLFKFTNKRWQEINDVEKIDKFFKELFEGKVNFNKAQKILLKDKQNLRRPFQRLLGKEGFKEFEDLVKEFVSFKEPYSILKKAEQQGFKELAKLGKTYLLDPKLSKWGAIGHLTKKAMQIIINKPQVARLWKDALVDLNKGNLAKAESELKQLDTQIKSAPKPE